MSKPRFDKFILWLSVELTLFAGNTKITLLFYEVPSRNVIYVPTFTVGFLCFCEHVKEISYTPTIALKVVLGALFLKWHVKSSVYKVTVQTLP